MLLLNSLPPTQLDTIRSCVRVRASILHPFSVRRSICHLQLVARRVRLTCLVRLSVVCPAAYHIDLVRDGGRPAPVRPRVDGRAEDRQAEHKAAGHRQPTAAQRALTDCHTQTPHTSHHASTHALCCVVCGCCQVSSLQQFVAACNASPSSLVTTAGSSLSTGGGPGSLTPTPSPLDTSVRGLSPLSSVGSTLDLGSGGALGDTGFPSITPDLEQTVSLLYGDSGEGASLHKEPDPKQAKESATTTTSAATQDTGRKPLT